MLLELVAAIMKNRNLNEARVTSHALTPTELVASFRSLQQPT